MGTNATGRGAALVTAEIEIGRYDKAATTDSLGTSGRVDVPLTLYSESLMVRRI